MYRLLIRPKVDKELLKISKKDRRLYEITVKKIEEILADPHRYKNLRAPLQDRKRVHIGRSYVMVFSIDEENRAVILTLFKHHDNAYRKKRS